MADQGITTTSADGNGQKAALKDVGIKVWKK